jgi:UPF0755 protein
MRKIIWLVFVAVIAGGAWFGWALLTPTSPPAQTFVMLHPGYSTRRIARELRGAGVIRSEQAFLLWHYFHRRPSLKAGEYLFDKAASAKDVHQRLARGDVYFHTVVVPEGFTMFDIARAVEAAGLGPAAEFLRVAQSDTALIGDMAPGAHSLEGYLFPDTYQFSRMQKMPEIAAAMVCQFRIVAHQIGLIPPAGEMEMEKDKDKDESANAAHLCGVVAMQFQNWSAPQNQSQTAVERTVTMASIVEKETAAPEERPMVASVYYNRLAKKIALDADPSIIYAELLAGTYTGALHHDDMQFNSPYNTYRSVGLPPGPIANPGKSALEAAMHPAQSDYYYFVADAQGHHRFAKTIEEHNKNVAAYRRAMRGQ